MRIDCCVSYFQKQLIGLLPNGTECLFYYSPNVPVGGYTVEGFLFDLDADINAVLNPYGIYYTNYYDSTDNYNFIMTYVGVYQPTYVPIIVDSFGNPVLITWDSCCTKTCYEITLNTDSTSDSCQYFDFGNNILPFFPDGFPLNDQAAWQTVLELFYGPQVVVTNTVTSTTVYLKIDNAYVCGTPRIQTYLIPYTDMVPCGSPPAAVCAYYNQIIDNTSGCFSTGLYDFEGCLNDFNCLASLYPNGYYVQDASGALFDFCSHLTVISNSTSQPAPINYLDFNGNPQTSNWTALCDYGCVQTNLFFVDNLIQEMNFCGIDISMSSYGGDLDLYDIPTAEAVLFGVFKTYFPSCTAVSIYFDGVKFLRITIFDIYYDSTSTLTVATVQNSYVLGLFPC